MPSRFAEKLDEDQDISALPQRVADFHRRIAEAIPCSPETAEVRSALNKKALGDLVICYLNYAARTVPPRPRIVCYAPSFWSSPLASTYGGQMAALEAKIRDGQDIRTHLSKDARSKGFLSRTSSKVVYPEKDLILNSFGLHHLHLQEKGRGDEIVFAKFDRHSALMVMIGNHRSFMDGSVAEANARLELASGNEIRGVQAPREPFDFQRQMRLAHVGITSMAHLQGKVTMGPWIVSSVNSMRHSRFADQILEQIRYVEERLDDRDYVKGLFSKHPERLQDRVKFEWRMEFTDLVLVERYSATGLRLQNGFC